MIQAIIFDCFGVLVRDGWLPFRDKYFTDNENFYQEAMDYNKQVDAGLLPYDIFIQNVAALTGVNVKQAHAEIEQNPPNIELFKTITALKSQYKIGLLSNAGGNWLHNLFSSEQLRLFDATVLSCEIGFSKPQPEAYQAICDRLELSPEDCIFIDDQPRYCAGAEDIGMKTVTFTDNASCVSKLNSLL